MVSYSFCACGRGILSELLHHSQELSCETGPGDEETANWSACCDELVLRLSWRRWTSGDDAAAAVVVVVNSSRSCCSVADATTTGRAATTTSQPLDVPAAVRALAIYGEVGCVSRFLSPNNLHDTRPNSPEIREKMLWATATSEYSLPPVPNLLRYKLNRYRYPKRNDGYVC